MRIEILNDEGEVVQEILADETFAEQIFPGRWRVSQDQGGPSTPVVPQAVTMAQARIAMHRAGISIAQVDAAIAALPEPPRVEAEIAWNFSNEVQRHNGFVSILGPTLGLAEEQIDQLFITAAAIRT